MEARRRRVDEDQRQLEAQRVQDAEDYNILKIKLETETQTLEQQLEEMRATYQLNQEKLDYNYRVLVERDSENTNTIKQQKKKLTRMADSTSQGPNAWAGHGTSADVCGARSIWVDSPLQPQGPVRARGAPL